VNLALKLLGKLAKVAVEIQFEAVPGENPTYGILEREQET
jgi:hypothetical protein